MTLAEKFIIADWNAVIDAATKDKEAVIAEQAAEITEQAAEIEALKKQLAEAHASKKR